MLAGGTRQAVKNCPMQDDPEKVRGSREITFAGQGRQEVYDWIVATLGFRRQSSYTATPALQSKYPMACFT